MVRDTGLKKPIGDPLFCMINEISHNCNSLKTSDIHFLTINDYKYRTAVMYIYKLRNVYKFFFNMAL